jgi:hypothetical protein
MLPAGFEPAIPTSERPQSHILELAANRIGYNKSLAIKNVLQNFSANSCKMFILHANGNKDKMGSTCRKSD